jgi:hypothetical protein
MGARPPRSTREERLFARERIVNRKPKRGGGHQRPRDDSLIGASEVAGILRCDRSTITRFAKLGLLKPAMVADGEVRWFDREWIVLLAAHFTLKRAGRKRRAAARG